MPSELELGPWTEIFAYNIIEKFVTSCSRMGILWIFFFSSSVLNCRVGARATQLSYHNRQRQIASAAHRHHPSSCAARELCVHFLRQHIYKFYDDIAVHTWCVFLLPLCLLARSRVYHFVSTLSHMDWDLNAKLFTQLFCCCRERGRIWWKIAAR